MKRRDFPGGWYCDALPREGSYYATLIRKRHIETLYGNVRLPDGQDALFIRIGDVGRFACCGARDDQAWEYDRGAARDWTSRGPVYGIHAVAFDAIGTLLTVPNPHHPAAPQGFRQIADDGRVIYVRDTYTQQYPYEWTTHGDLTIGQGDHGPLGEDPCIAKMPDGSFRLIEPGRCRMIRFHRDGDHLVVAMVREDIASAVIWWLTVAELDALPRFTRPQKLCDLVYVRGDGGTCPRCGHDKTLHTQREPEVEPVSIPDHVYIVRAVDDLYPHLLKENTIEACGVFTERCVRALHAVDPKWGHVKKVVPQTQFNGHAVDSVMYRTAPANVVDIISNGHNPPQHGSPAWQITTSGGQAWLDPAGVEDVDGGDGGNGGNGGGTTDDTVEVPTAAAYAALLKRLDAVEGTAKEAREKAQQALDKSGGGGLQDEQTITIQTANGRVLCAEGGGSNANDEPVRLTSRSADAIGDWEKFKVRIQ